MNDLLDHQIVAALGEILDAAPAPGARPGAFRAATADATSSMSPSTDVDLAAIGTPVHGGGRVLRLIAVALVLSCLGVVTWSRHRSSSPDAPIGVRPAVTTTPVGTPKAASSTADVAAGGGETVTASTPTASVTTAATTAPVGTLADYAGWFLPSYVPDGYEITSIVATYAPLTRSPAQRWVRTDAAGATVAQLIASTSAIVPVVVVRPSPSNASVHGLPASVFDSGEGSLVNWQEVGRQAQVRGLGLSQTEVVALAEQLTLDAGAGSFTLDGASDFRPLSRVPAAEHAVDLNVGLLRSDGAPGGFVEFTSTPNADGETLGVLKQRLATMNGVQSAIEHLGDLDRLVWREPVDGYGPFTRLTWLQDGMIVEVSGRAAPEDMIKFATSIASVDPQQLIVEGRHITEQLAARETLEETTFADGVTVAVKRRRQDVIGLCVGGVDPVCRWDVSESSLGGGGQTASFDVFDIDGRRVLLGWHEGFDEPTLVPQPPGPSPAGEVPPSTSTLTEVQRGALGQFVEIVVPAGEQPPSVAYGTSQTGVGLRPGTTLLRF